MLFKKKQAKQLEPQYYYSATNIKTLNYKVYYMNIKEKIMYFILAFVVGYIVGYLFYGGIGKDSYGNETTITQVLNVFIPSVVGLITGNIFLPQRSKQILNKRRRELSSQFRDMLDGLTTSLGAGNNVLNSFSSVYDDLKNQYSEDDFIIKELEVILAGIQSNVNIEDMLKDFGKRSGISDIESFAGVFDVCYRKGGNIQDVVQSAHTIISKKMEIREDIETIVSGNKLDQKVMAVMPIGIIGIIKAMSPDFASNFVSPIGIISTTIAIILFVVSYFVGKKIMEIKI